jgi:hypothetical protein
MELLNPIRCMSLRLKLPFREIARRTGLLCNTVKKHLNAGTIKPKFAISSRPGDNCNAVYLLSLWLTEVSVKPELRPSCQNQIYSVANWCR